MTSRISAFDLFAIATCTLAWGTTWYAITLQFGLVDPVVSIAYRFALAAVLLFALAALRREPLGLTRAQHFAAFGIGVFTFGMNYALVYWAEERVNSAVVAVCFAALAFVNLIVFRIAFAQRAAPLAWAGAALGVAGVAWLSWGEASGAALDARAIAGLALAFAAVLSSAIGNLYARRGETIGTPLIPSTAWAMAYGVAGLAVFALMTGRAWAFDPRPAYVLSLIYLAVVGSVIAFVLYYTLARRRGYALASYISALTPVVAIVVSSVFEAKTWGLAALGGVVLVLIGQYLLLRGRGAS